MANSVITTIIGCGYNDGREYRSTPIRVKHNLAESELLSVLRKAVQDFVNTEEGRDLYKDNNGDFNWGDAAMDIPDDHWLKYGIFEFEMTPAHNNDDVDHDEKFVPEDIE